MSAKISMRRISIASLAFPWMILFDSREFASNNIP
jgi:hypothetical protein